MSNFLPYSPGFSAGGFHLTDEDIAEFKALWKKQTGKQITTEEAEVYAHELLLLVNIFTQGKNTDQSK